MSAPAAAPLTGLPFSWPEQQLLMRSALAARAAARRIEERRAQLDRAGAEHWALSQAEAALSQALDNLQAGH